MAPVPLPLLLTVNTAACMFYLQQTLQKEKTIGKREYRTTFS